MQPVASQILAGAPRPTLPCSSTGLRYPRIRSFPSPIPRSAPYSIRAHGRNPTATTRSWEYVELFYASRRAWTDVIEDAACPDFFALGDGHMLLMHGHRPYSQCHYYLGRYVEQRFEPEEHGRMNWPGECDESPTLDRSRCRGFTSYHPGARAARVADSPSDGRTPACLAAGPDTHEPVDGVCGECLELDLEIDPGGADRAGVAVRSSPGREEETLVFADLSRGARLLRMDAWEIGPAAPW